MPFDGFIMRRVVEETAQKITNQQLRNIFFHEGSLVLTFDGGELRVCLNPNHAHIVFAEKLTKDPSRNSFAELLRSRLRGGVVVDFRTLGFERTAVLHINKIDELTVQHYYLLYFDIMGKHSNAILVENGTIVDAFKRVETRFRSIKPGEKFVEFSSGKLSLDEVLEQGVFQRTLETLRDGEPNKFLSSFLIATIQGFSKTLAEEVLLRADVEEIPISSVSNWELFRLLDALKGLRDEFLGGKFYLYYVGGVPADLSTFRLRRYTDWKTYSSALPCVSEYFDYVEKRDRFLQKRHSLLSVLKSKLNDLTETLQKVNSDLRECENFDEFRKFGELLKAYSYQIPVGASEVQLWDWESDSYVNVTLDPKLSAIENSAKYFHMYSRLKRKHIALRERAAMIEGEINYIEQVLISVEDAEDLRDLLETEDEMRSTDLLKDSTKRVGGAVKNRQTPLRSEPRRFVYNGFTILVGKNNRQNDELVRDASDRDIWLHVQGMPGAHVLIKTGGRQVDDETLHFAGRLAATYSRARFSGKVPVDYTLAKNVRKPKGLKPGMVLYSDFKTIFVQPIDDLIGSKLT